MRALRNLWLPLLVGLLLATGLTRAREVHAATLNVPCDGPTLSSVIATVNSNGQEDLVWLAPSCDYVLPASWVVEMDQDSPVWIFGRGATISGGKQRTVFLVNPYATLHLMDVTVTAGKADDDGGAIVNRGTLTLTRGTVSASTSPDYGGGIYNTGTLRLTDSIVSGNSASTSGGGVYNSEAGTMTLIDSTVSGNSSLYGGGIRNGHRAALFNSTLFDNEASLGGAFLNESLARAALSHVTVSDNGASAPSGGGIRNTSILALENSIVANTRAGGLDCYNSGTILASGGNLVEDGSCAIAGALSGDPRLLGRDDLLALTGGRPTFIPLLHGSPAIDAASNADCPGLDQAGTRRPQDGSYDGTSLCDLGAYESACGLLGIEPFLLLPFARRLARARARRRDAPVRGQGEEVATLEA